jgi:hypothetical protein
MPTEQYHEPPGELPEDVRTFARMCTSLIEEAEAIGWYEQRLAVETEPVQGEPCRFRTAWPLTLWPVEIENVRLSGLPLAAPPNPLATGAVSVLRITLRCSAAGGNFAQIGLDRLRVFLRGAANVALPLYELLCAHTLSVAYAESHSDPAAVVLPPSVIEPAGFAPEEALLPWPARSFAGFRLLTEYFALPEKFLFLDFCRIDGKSLLCDGNRMEIFVYLDRALPELERSIGAAARFRESEPHRPDRRFLVQDLGLGPRRHFAQAPLQLLDQPGTAGGDVPRSRRSNPNGRKSTS